MRNRTALALSLISASTLMLAGCGADSANSSSVTDALASALAAEPTDNNVAALPINKSIATNYDEGRQFLVARKTGNVQGRSNCGRFDITSSRPSARWSFNGKGDSSYSQGVEVCVL